MIKLTAATTVLSPRQHRYSGSFSPWDKLITSSGKPACRDFRPRGLGALETQQRMSPAVAEIDQ